MAPLSILLLGGSGTIGRATAQALRAEGHRVTVLIRPGSEAPPGCTILRGQVEPSTLAQAMTGIDAVVSCLASRTGEPKDAWAIDHAANSAALKAAVAAGARHFTLLSAICVQKPLLEFQRAKLAFEAELQAAPLDWTIVRPTAFFKSPLRPGPPRPTGPPVPGLRRRPANRLQTYLRRRPRPLPRPYPD